MHPTTHLIVSWLVGQHMPDRRDRRLIAWAGLAPDLDGLSLLAGVEAYGRWHHVVMHGAVAAVGVSVVCAALARDRARVALLALLAFHLHLLCDLFGSGVAWGIVYFWPFNDHEFFSPYRWELVSWQNFLTTVVVLIASGWVALRRGYTFAEVVMPARWDAAVAQTLRQRFGRSMQPDEKLVSCGEKRMKTRVLFVCPGNSCRSQMAEGLLRHLAGDRYDVVSAGTQPAALNPWAVEVMKEIGVDISRQRSKKVDEFLGQRFDYAITVCDREKESRPMFFPGWCPMLLQHWNIDDPADAQGTAEQRRAVFCRVRDEIAGKIRSFMTEADAPTNVPAV